MAKEGAEGVEQKQRQAVVCWPKANATGFRHTCLHAAVCV